MQVTKKIEFSDLNRAGQSAIHAAEFSTCIKFGEWGFEVPEYHTNQKAWDGLRAAMVAFLLECNKPAPVDPSNG